MKLHIYMDNGANIHSRRTTTLDTDNDLGIDEAGWKEMDDMQKHKLIEEWMQEAGWLEIGWEEEA